MAFTQYNLEGNGGELICITSINRDEFTVKIGEDARDPLIPPVNITERQYHYHYDLGAGKPSSVLNIPRNLPICAVGINDIFNHYSDPKPSEYYSSDVYAGMKELFDGCAYWVWGSYDTGGMVVVRTGTDQVEISIINGFYQIGDNAFCYNTGKKIITVEQSQNIICTLEVGALPQNGLQFMIGTGENDVSLLQPVKNIIGNIDYYEPIESYDDVKLSTWAEYSQFIGIEKQTTQPDEPAYLWGGNVAGYIWATADLPVQNVLISGSWNGNVEVDDEGNPFLPGGLPLPAGGWGAFPSQSDTIDFTNPANFEVDVISSGILTLYKPTAEQLSQFQTFLFSGITDSISNQLKKLTSDPLQYLLFVAMVHYNPLGNEGQEIGYAGIPTGVYATKLNKQYTQIDCGTISVPEASKSFLDYEPYSKVSIYLPYIGVESLNIEDCMGSDIHVVYNINQLDGSCLVQIKCTRRKRVSSDTTINSVLYHFNGNCFTTIPMFATDWRGAINSAISLIGGITSFASGNVGAGISSIAGAITQEKVSLKRSSNTSSNYGYMDNQKPYLILERPNQNVPSNFGALEGYTSNLHRSIGKMKGFTIVYDDTMWTKNINCSKEEADEIRRIMAGGVYL